MRKIRALFRGNAATLITLADQALVSGSNFLLGILLTRFIGLDQYGTFTLAWMTVLFASSLQQALIITPMMSFGPKKKEGDASHYYSQTLSLQCVFTLFAILITFLVIRLTGIFVSDPTIQTLLWIQPIMVGVFLIQEYYRRYFFIIGKSEKALAMDIIAYGGMLGAILYGSFFATINLRISILILVVSFSVSSFLGASLARMIPAALHFLKQVCQSHWHFSSWLTGKALLQFFSGNYFLVAAGAILGTTGVGAIRIAQNLTGLTHVLFLSLENIVPAKAALALKKDGYRPMVKYLKQVSFRSGFLVACILLGMTLGAEWIIHYVYGPEQIQYAYLLRGFCLLYVLVFVGYPLRFFLRTLEFTKPIFFAYVIGTVFSLPVAFPLVRMFDLNGVVMGLMGTQIIFILVYLIMIHRKNKMGRLQTGS